MEWHSGEGVNKVDGRLPTQSCPNRELYKVRVAPQVRSYMREFSSETRNKIQFSKLNLKSLAK